MHLPCDFEPTIRYSIPTSLTNFSKPHGSREHQHESKCSSKVDKESSMVSSTYFETITKFSIVFTLREELFWSAIGTIMEVGRLEESWWESRTIVTSPTFTGVIDTLEWVDSGTITNSPAFLFCARSWLLFPQRKAYNPPLIKMVPKMLQSYVKLTMLVIK